MNRVLIALVALLVGCKEEPTIVITFAPQVSWERERSNIVRILPVRSGA